MGSAFALGVVAAYEVQAQEWLAQGVQEIQRIEAFLSEFKPDSETSLINREAGIQPVRVSSDCFALLHRCQAISRLTQGDFDLTVKPLKRLYKFKNTEFAFPDPAVIEQTLNKVGYQKIILDDSRQTVTFEVAGMEISFAAVGKGYASDKVKQLWQRMGVPAGFVNASGDLNAFGTKPDGSSWKIGIADPRASTIDACQPIPNQESLKTSESLPLPNRPILLYVPLTEGAAATSGDYEQHFFYEGKRYSHNINPHTGLPLTGVKSVTVFSPSAELSDALATAVYVKGVAKGIEFVNQLPQTHCIVIDGADQFNFSSNLRYETIAP